MLWWYQDNLLYLPNAEGRKGEQRSVRYNPRGFRSPAEHELPFEEHYLTASDTTIIHTWLLLQAEKSSCPTIIFFHGNAGNIGFRLPFAKSLYWRTAANILMVDYRGYGNSVGTPTERGLVGDAQACLDFIKSRKDLDSSKIFVFGQSLGGAVALTLAHRNQKTVSGVLVENTFTSIDDMVIILLERLSLKQGFLFIRIFLYVFLTNHWSNKKIIRTLTTPILFISGLADELIPPAAMQELYDLSTQSRSRQFLGIEGGEHNTTFIQGAEKYYDTFTSFILRHTAPNT
eukprot:TRINITY_DN9872_c0_g1_i16.p1 TRINITY_DN9872_c0_g1~~TRINITY_DN9872_c0_g1_i16.p1  ORF type:complete len:288 (+),score=12.85 TRINITY_DN9872_c0_g1_i16:136-999(+)